MEPLVVGVCIAFLYILLTHVLGLIAIEKWKFTTLKALNSLAIGIATSYLILILIPETLLFAGRGNIVAPIILLLVFTAQFIIHKIIAKNENKVRERAIHLISEILYHFFIGILFMVYSGLDPLSLFVFFLPIFTHGAFSHLIRHNKHLLIHTVENHKLIRELKLWNIVAIILGVFVASIVKINALDITILLGLITGTYIYSIFLENMTDKKEIDNKWLITGQVFYIILFVMSHTFTLI